MCLERTKSQIYEIRRRRSLVSLVSLVSFVFLVSLVSPVSLVSLVFLVFLVLCLGLHTLFDSVFLSNLFISILLVSAEICGTV